MAQTEKYIEDLLTRKPKSAHSNILVVKDIRLFLNTINKAIDTMKNAGIPAVAERHEESGCIEYRVRIPIQNHTAS